MLSIVLCAGTASAAVRYAAPGAAGASPCNPAPCSLSTAVNGAVGGDRVILAAGDYATADLVLDKAIDVGGEPGAATSIVFSGAGGALVAASGAVLHDVRVAFATGTMAYALQLEAGTVERVYADGRNGIACLATRGTIRDSVCLDSLNVSPSGPGKFQVNVVNVTAVPLLIGAFEGAILSANVVNTIAQPGYEMGSNASGLLIDVSTGSSASAVLSNSNYASVDSSLSTGENFSFTPPGTNGNQTAAPEFVDGPAGNFRQLGSSPTIDTGLADPLLGTLDLDGAARSQARCIGGTPVPDIGAYELTPTVPCPGGATTPATASGDFHFGRLKHHPGKGTATLSVIVSGAGTIVLHGKGLVRRQRRSATAGTVRLLVKAKGRAAKVLRRKGRRRVRPLVDFTPEGGPPVRRARSVSLRLRGPGR